MRFFLIFLSLLISCVAVWAQTSVIDPTKMTYRQAFDSASAELESGRFLSDSDLNQLMEMSRKLRESGDADLAQQMMLLVAAARQESDRAQGFKNDENSVANVWQSVHAEEASAQNRQIWQAMRDWSLGLTLAGVAGSTFLLLQMQTAEAKSSTAYNQRLEDASRVGATISLSFSVLFFVSLVTSESHL